MMVNDVASRTTAYWLATGCPPQPISETAPTPTAATIIVRQVTHGDDVGAITDDVLRLRQRDPRCHVGIWILSDTLPEAACPAIQKTATADFAGHGPEPPDAAAIRTILLEPLRLLELAGYWYDAWFPRGSEIARCLFVAMHDPTMNRLRLPEIADVLGTSPRTLTRHVGQLGNITPRHLRTLGRLVNVGIDVSRKPCRSIASHAGGHAFIEYSTFYRTFANNFGFAPRDAKSLVGPAGLWAAWRSRHMG